MRQNRTASTERKRICVCCPWSIKGENRINLGNLDMTLKQFTFEIDACLCLTFETHSCSQRFSEIWPMPWKRERNKNDTDKLLTWYTINRLLNDIIGVCHFWRCKTHGIGRRSYNRTIKINMNGDSKRWRDNPKIPWIIILHRRRI